MIQGQRCTCLYASCHLAMCTTTSTTNQHDGSKQLPVLHTVECSMYCTLAGRSSGENASLFRALPLYSCYDAPSPLTDVRSPCQFNCGAFFCQPSLTPAGVLSFHPNPVTSFFHSLLESFCYLRCFFSLCKVLPLSSTL